MLVNTSQLVANIQPQDPFPEADPASGLGYIKYGLYARKTMFFHAYYKAFNLEFFKGNKENAAILADILSILIRYFIPNPAAWSIITTPKRIHTERLGYHFASEILLLTAAATGINFIEDVICTRNKSKMEPEFFLNKPLPPAPFILYDDILTTGMTIYASLDLIREATGSTPLIIVGINNN